MEKKNSYITEEVYDAKTENIVHRLIKVEDNVDSLKDDFTRLNISLAKQEVYQEKSLETLEYIKENTGKIHEVKAQQDSLKTQVEEVLDDFENIKKVTKEKSGDNKDIIIKLLGVVGTLGAAAIGAGWFLS